MEKHTATLTLTYNVDSGAVSWFVEHASVGVAWDLISEGCSTPLNATSDAVSCLMRWLAARTGG